MIRHSFAEREVGSWLPTETAQTRSCSWRLNPEKAKCPIPLPPRRAAAIWRRYAFSSTWPWQDIDAMRSRMPGNGRISPRCVPGRQSVAFFSLHASSKAPRTGKAPLPGNISPPCIQNELALARYARHVSEKPRKSPFGNASREDLAREGPFSLHRPLESCMGHESCYRSRLSGKGSGRTGKTPAFGA